MFDIQGEVGSDPFTKKVELVGIEEEGGRGDGFYLTGGGGESEGKSVLGICCINFLSCTIYSYIFYSCGHLRSVQNYCS